jgi:hypothetical protein
MSLLVLFNVIYTEPDKILQKTWYYDVAPDSMVKEEITRSESKKDITVPLIGE